MNFQPPTVEKTTTLAHVHHTAMESLTLRRPQQLHTYQRTVVRRPVAAAALVVNSHSEVLMIRQLREAVDPTHPIWEIPAGKVDPGEDSLSAVKRELAEEAQLQASFWIPISSIFVSPGWTDEQIDIYFGKNVAPCLDHPADDDEEIEVQWMELDEAIDSTQDGKSLVALYWLKSQG